MPSDQKPSVDTTAPIGADGGAAGGVSGVIDCPHCHKQFDPSVDAEQLPRLQGSKCPHCRLFVPARHLAAQ